MARILILGAGRVGESVAESLVSEQNDITVIDMDPARLRLLGDKLDLRGVVGNGIQPSVLRDAGVKDADMVIACAAQDETNLVVCKVAHDVFNVPTTIARLRSPEFTDGEGDEQRSLKAMDAVMAELVDPDQHIVRLFTPPLERTSQDPGYIKAYPPGVRENGGQYTHAATWVALAFAEQGRAEEAWRVFQMLNPVSHAGSREAAEHYRVEPYVVAADIYGEGDLAGRGGWTWYTGSAGWLYRVGVEGILGIRRQGDKLVIRPVLPAAWDGYSAEVTLNGARHKISVQRDQKSGEPIVSINNSVTKNAHEGILL